MRVLLAHLRLLRPLNLAIGAGAVLISASIADRWHQRPEIVLALLVVVLYNAAANAANDYCDYHIDLINRPERPLSSGLVTRNTARILAAGLFLAGSLLAITLPVGAGLTALLIALPLMVLYSPVLKGLPLVGNITVALILGLTFIFSGLAVGNPDPLIVPAVLAFGLTLLRELVKDIADVEGDRAANLHTFPLLRGTRTAVITAIVLALGVGFGSLIPFVTGYYGKAYLVLLILGVELPLAALIHRFVKNPGPETAQSGARWLKFSTLAGVLAIYLG